MGASSNRFGRALVLSSAALVACQSRGADPRVPLEVPNAVSGGTRGGGRPDSPSTERMRASEEAAQAEKDRKAADAQALKLAEAERLWASGVAKADRDPGDAADDFKKLADDHPGDARADEARFRSAVSYQADEDWNAVVAALMQYMKDFPVNPHLRDVERMLYDASLRVIAGAKGFSGVFKSDKKGFDGLKAIPERFPEGEFADDALLALGDAYVEKDDAVDAALAYRQILLSYPQSELAPRARLRLGDTYLSRDQGDAYHAGYVDVDPRGSRSPQALANRPVVSCVETALATYREFMAEDRARASADDVAYAQSRIDECRARIAGKDRSIASFYASRGDALGAQTYARLADDALAGRTKAEGWAPEPNVWTPATPPEPDATPPSVPPVRATPPPTVTPAVPPPAVSPSTVPPPRPTPPPPTPVPPSPPRVPPPYVPPPAAPPPRVPPTIPPPSIPPPYVPMTAPPAPPSHPPAFPPGSLPPPRHIEGVLSPAPR